MTEHDHSSDIDDSVAAYALGALEPGELEELRLHLETCGACRDELAALQRVVDALPMSVPQHPASRRLRRRVLEALKRQPELAVAKPRRAGPLSRLVAGAMNRPALALGCALAVTAILVAGAERGSPGNERTRVIAAVVAGPGTAAVTVTGAHAELTVHHLPPPPAGHIYEVWLARPGRAPAPTTALFSVNSDGDGDVEVPGNLHGVDGLMVTPEPDGGSRVPTRPAVIRAQLS